MKITEYNTRLNEERLPILAEKVKYNIDGRMRYTSPRGIGGKTPKKNIVGGKKQ